MANGEPKRELISEEELLKHHSKEMYEYLKSTLRFDNKVPIKTSELMSPTFEARFCSKTASSNTIRENISDPVSENPSICTAGTTTMSGSKGIDQNT